MREGELEVTVTQPEKKTNPPCGSQSALVQRLVTTDWPAAEHANISQNVDIVQVKDDSWEWI